MITYTCPIGLLLPAGPAEIVEITVQIPQNTSLSMPKIPSKHKHTQCALAPIWSNWYDGRIHSRHSMATLAMSLLTSPCRIPESPSLGSRSCYSEVRKVRKYTDPISSLLSPLAPTVYAMDHNCRLPEETVFQKPQRHWRFSGSGTFIRFFEFRPWCVAMTWGFRLLLNAFDLLDSLIPGMYPSSSFIWWCTKWSRHRKVFFLFRICFCRWDNFREVIDKSLPFMAAGSQLSVLVPGNSASSYCCIARKCLNAPQKHLLRMLNACIGGQQLELLFKTGWHSDEEDFCKNGILICCFPYNVQLFSWHKQEKLRVLSCRRVWGSNALPQTTSPWSWQTAQGEV